MHIPVKVDYGVRALVDLALHADQQPIRASEIAQRTLIPEPYLAQVMHTLGKAGIVRAQRGPQGGHALALDPEDIRLSMVMECLGSTEHLVACMDSVGSCVHIAACAQREVWLSVELAVFQILDSKTIFDLVVRSQAIANNASKKLASRSEPLTFQPSKN